MTFELLFVTTCIVLCVSILCVRDHLKCLKEDYLTGKRLVQAI